MGRLGAITVATLLAVRPAVAAPVEDAPATPEAAPDAEPTAAASDPPPASTAPSEEELELRAQQAFEAGRYLEVVELAAEAYARTGELRHLYAQAHAERFAGNCEAALGHYARVMAAEPESMLGQHARDGIKLCEQQLPRERPRPDVEPAAQDETPTTPKSPRRPDPLGSTLLTFGIASLAGATALAVLAGTHARRLEAAVDERTLLDEQRRARVFEGASIAVGVAGSALVVAGIVRLVQRRPQRRR